ncbi:hypothetical protein M378DRAFT_18933 [Amanita muscaria Koide BX008]|uniref:Uncharacterized protein n=1 Tax=Amanita muscaria (strain Koide BX008) TaxID=946122 RepID=A0A0C2WCT1_AMAMK|nr:hypothetical protein M378DRAFT_18933 [Amanita muscaria Koide BX008]
MSSNTEETELQTRLRASIKCKTSQLLEVVAPSSATKTNDIFLDSYAKSDISTAKREEGEAFGKEQVGQLAREPGQDLPDVAVETTLLRDINEPDGEHSLGYCSLQEACLHQTSVRHSYLKPLQRFHIISFCHAAFEAGKWAERYLQLREVKYGVELDVLAATILSTFGLHAQVALTPREIEGSVELSVTSALQEISGVADKGATLLESRQRSCWQDAGPLKGNKKDVELGVVAAGSVGEGITVLIEDVSEAFRSAMNVPICACWGKGAKLERALGTDSCFRQRQYLGFAIIIVVSAASSSAGFAWRIPSLPFSSSEHESLLVQPEEEEEPVSSIKDAISEENDDDVESWLRVACTAGARLLAK